MTTKLAPDTQVQTVQTPGNALTTIASFAIPVGAKCFYQAVVIAGSGADALAESITGGVNDVAGATALLTNVTASTSVNRTAGAATWAVTVDVSGSNLRIRVTGVLATTIDWLCQLHVWVYVP